MGKTRFPSHNLPMEDKLTPEYGLKIAEAIHSNGVPGWRTIFNTKDDFKQYLEFALDRRNPNEGKQFLRLRKGNESKSYLPYIDWAVRNYLTKRINLAITKTAKYYDPKVDAVDLEATSEFERKKLQVKSFIGNRDFYSMVEQDMGISMAPGGVDPNELPDTPKDVDEWAETAFRLKSCYALEILLKDIMEENRFEEVKKQCKFDAMVFGRAVIWHWIDSSGKVRNQRISADRCIVPWSDKPSHDDMQYCAYLESWSSQELAEHTDLSKAKIDDIMKRYGGNSDRHRYFSSNGWIGESYRSHTQDVDRVEVMRFRYRTYDDLVYEKNNENGSFDKRPYNYYRGTKQEEKYKKKFGSKKKVVRARTETILEGWWVVGSDCVYSYGKMIHQPKKGSLSRRGLGVTIYSPNMYDGEVTPLVKDAIPVLRSIRRINLKIQHLMSSAKVSGIGIDIEALQSVRFSIGNKDMKPHELLDMFVQDGLLLYNGEKMSIGSGRKPFTDLGSMIDAQGLATLLQLKEKEMDELDELIGFNRVTSAGNLHHDTGKGVAELQQQMTLDTLDFLVDTEKYMMEEAMRTNGVLALQSIKYYPDLYKSGIGNRSIGLLNGADLLRHDYNFAITMQPTQMEWQQFYADLKQYVQAGTILPEDEVYVRQITNLKQAEFYLVSKTKARRKEAQRMAEQNAQQNAAIQQQSAQASMQAEMAKMQAKTESEIALERERQNTERIKTEGRLQAIRLEAELRASLGEQPI